MCRALLCGTSRLALVNAAHVRANVTPEVLAGDVYRADCHFVPQVDARGLGRVGVVRKGGLPEVPDTLGGPPLDVSRRMLLVFTELCWFWTFWAINGQ